MIAIGAFIAVAIEMDMAFEHDLGLRRDLEGNRLAIDQLHLGPAQQTGELILGQRVRHRRDGGEDGAGIGADHGGDGHGLGPRLAPAFEMLRAAAMLQPAHIGRVPARHLHAVDAEIIGVVLAAISDPW